jgi:prepilin-type N-terminal cleavage/methylation domain-containing protein/prepilin-type processing-associated H-X9-DG protein
MASRLLKSQLLEPAERERSSTRCSLMNRRRGFTLTEVGVVLLIVAVLLALLLPAVQYARESARRLNCQSNLRTIALGVISHESQHAQLPSLYNGSFLPKPRTVMDEFHFHSWRTAILPQIEQNALYTLMNFSLPATDASNQPFVNVQLPVFQCPSTPNSSQFVPQISDVNGNNVGTAARSDYEAIAGVNIGLASGTESLENIQFGVWGEPDSYRRSSTNYRKPRLRDVADGLSQTILIAERAGRPDWHERGKPVLPYPKPNEFGAVMDTHQASWAISTHFWWLVQSAQSGVNNRNLDIFAFHSGGANVALADGSVQFLSETIAAEAVNALITRSENETVKPE